MKRKSDTTDGNQIQITIGQRRSAPRVWKFRKEQVVAICLASDDGRRVGHAVDKTMMRCGTGWPGRGGGRLRGGGNHTFAFSGGSRR